MGYDPNQPRDEIGRWTSTFGGTWYSGQQAGSLEDAIDEKGGVIYLTRDEDFADGYGTTYELNIDDPGNVFDTGNSEQVDQVVDKMFDEYDSGRLPSELDDMVSTAVDQYGREGARDRLFLEFSPSEIRNESIYDDGAVQTWLWERFEFDMVGFSGGDTALVLNAYRYVGK